MKNTLDRAKEEMAAASKAAQDEARNKSKTVKKTAPAAEPLKKDETPLPENSSSSESVQPTKWDVEPTHFYDPEDRKVKPISEFPADQS